MGQFSFVQRFIKGVKEINSWAGNCKFGPSTEGANIYLYLFSTSNKYDPQPTTHDSQLTTHDSQPTTHDLPTHDPPTHAI